MGMQESRGKLAHSIKDLLALWAHTKTQWNDANTERFEETFLRPLEIDLRGTAGAMDHMAAMLTQIRHQCE